MSCSGPVCGSPDSTAVVISRLAFVHFADSRSRSKSRALSMAAAAAEANARTAPSWESENTRAGPVVGQVEIAEVSGSHGDWYAEQRSHRRVMLVQLPGLRVSSQILDANPLTYRQITEPPRCLVVDSRVDEGHKGAVRGADTQGSVAGVSQLHRRVDDSMQRHI